jgi:hypothetical protein
MRSGLPSRPSNPGFEAEEALWAEIIRREIDSWNPRRLPARFQPGNPQRPGRFWGTPPLALAVWLILLLTALTGLSSNAAGVLQKLAGVRETTAPSTPGQRAGLATRSARQPPHPNRSRSSPRPTSPGTAGASPAGAPLGTASAPRTTSPAPGTQPPLPTTSPARLTEPSPGDPHLPSPAPPLSDAPPSGLSRDLGPTEHSRG